MTVDSSSGCPDAAARAETGCATAARAPALHYVAFRGDEYTAAMRVFGPPDFIHIGWDRWAKLEVVPGDTVVFARGDFDEAPSIYSYPDIHET